MPRNPKNLSLKLEDIGTGYPGLSVAFGKAMLEACVVTLHRSEHKSGVKLRLTGMHNESVSLIWNGKFTKQMDRTWKDQEEATEYSATCLSILLAKAITSHVVIERSVKSTGFDYWLGDNTDNLDLFERKARLEISGLFKGSDSEINQRVKDKKEQTKKSDKLKLPAYISVIQFKDPKGKFIKRK